MAFSSKDGEKAGSRSGSVAVEPESRIRRNRELAANQMAFNAIGGVKIIPRVKPGHRSTDSGGHSTPHL